MLASSFLSHAPPAVVIGSAQLAEDLEPLLRDLLATAQAAWSNMPVPPEAFAAHLGRHTPVDAVPEHLLPSLYVEDLYLACACAQGIPEALRAFDERYLSRVRDWLSSGDALGDGVAETQQVLRERLMVGDGRPRIAEFSGRGSLLGWVRTAAVRVAADLHRKRLGHPLDGDEDAALRAAALAMADDPELELIQARCWDDFKRAFAAAMASISPKERTVLRLYYIEGLTQEQIAPMLRMERSNVSRWVKQVRKTIFEQTQRSMQERLGLSAQEFESLLKLIRSHFDQSMARLLNQDGAGPAS